MLADQLDKGLHETLIKDVFAHAGVIKDITFQNRSSSIKVWGIYLFDSNGADRLYWTRVYFYQICNGFACDIESPIGLLE